MLTPAALPAARGGHLLLWFAARPLVSQLPEWLQWMADFSRQSVRKERSSWLELP